MKLKSTNIYLLRHGEVANYKGEFVYNGHGDIDITKNGEEQLVLQAERLKGHNIKKVYSSDLKRAVKGGSTIASVLSVDLIEDRRLREISTGRWEGLTYREVAERYPEEVKIRFSDIVNYRIKGGGENLPDVEKRSMEAVLEVVNRHRGKDVAIVAHGGVNRVILCNAMGLDLKNILRIEQDFGCLNIVKYYEDTAVVKLINMIP